MLATAKYSDIRCWPCHYCTVLYMVLSLGHNLQISTSALFADTVGTRINRLLVVRLVLRYYVRASGLIEVNLHQWEIYVALVKLIIAEIHASTQELLRLSVSASVFIHKVVQVEIEYSFGTLAPRGRHQLLPELALKVKIQRISIQNYIAKVYDSHEITS